MTVRKAYEFNYPIVPIIQPSHEGDLPKTHSDISIQPDNTILTVIKKAEDSDDTILRFYETSGKDSKAVIRTSGALKGARETDLPEEKTSELPVQERTIKVPTSKQEIKTIKIITST